MIKRTGERISQSAERFMKENGLGSNIRYFNWQFNLVDSDVPNAWCMPGGKIVFYKGILPLTQDEDGAAVVMGHEVAHAVARHGNERMSQGLLAQMGGIALAVAIEEKPEETKQLFMAAYGLGATYGLLLPYSRTHEYEADRIGLVIMAMAGYNPAKAVDFWGRMAQMDKNNPPEFLSTHPSDQNRINEIKKFLPEAMKYYNK
jgi:predicted Zn-dependent protease